MSNCTLENIRFLIWEHAKSLYAAHRSHQQMMHIAVKENARNHCLLVMEQSKQEIIRLGGKVETGFDGIGIKRPLISYADGEIIDYEIGRLESDKFLNNP